MSMETMEWLNRYTLIGFTDKRGTAWHYRSDLQGTESNHYADAIPVDDVLSRLFNFEVMDAPVTYLVPGKVDGALTTFKKDGEVYSVIESQQGRKGMLASDNFFDLGAFKSGYTGHAYKEWLLDNVAAILDDNLGIGSAGLLRNRAQAWVSVEVPETITTPEGVSFRPNLLACTSFDGSLATTYKRVIQAVVCDNTLSIGLSEDGQAYKVKHTKHSAVKIADAREALAILHSMTDDFASEVAALCSWEVSEKAFDKLMDLVLPIPSEADAKAKKSITVVEKKRDEIVHLYRADERASTWRGTAFGVLQAFNTWNHHYAQIRGGAPRIIRNMENVVMDKFAAKDQDVLTVLSKVTKHNPNAKVAV